MNNKRYYWLKLNENFFEDDTIQWLEEQENGDKYVIFYLKLALKSLQDNGKLIRYVGEKLMPYDVKALSKLTNTDSDTVKVAMNLFVEIGLVEILDTGELFMKQIEEMTGSETAAAKRMRKSRAKQKLLEQTVDKTSQCYSDVHKSDTEKEIEKELDIELDKEQDKSNATTADSLKALYQFYQENFGIITPYIQDDIKDYSELQSPELVQLAMEKALDKQKPWSYAKGILKNWLTKNIKTLDQAQAEEVQFNNSRKNRGMYVEPVPEWMKQQGNSKQSSNTQVYEEIDEVELMQQLNELMGG
ncbi:phage replisome organizer N-terminal domain-containing protein [Suicoccus acidiformans]|uniref:phage replisome organizer N-terminal domain-containing protein n=1 Tax=Suicoccus acidiformans TaxID=2036206 RepID=UPI001F098C8D|nr:phage replisome organizer N-terminal domain-containing protein [Suicoccus acidiformans]